MSKTRKKALIFGISGQDGAYLAKWLLSKGYQVVGTSRDHQVSRFHGLTYLGICDKIRVESASLNDFRSVLQVIKNEQPHEIYNLAGQSSVGLSFHQPVETFESISIANLNLLEAIRFLEMPVRYYNAGSSECFGNTNGMPASETTPFRPRSPYAVAKAASVWQVANYREAYNLFACSGLLFNHESPLRPDRFVTSKIVKSACRIANGHQETLRLGNTAVERDWGWAPEYVQAMWLMLQQDKPDDFVIATGETNSLASFADAAFSCLGLDWREHTEHDDSLLRASDLLTIRADPRKAERQLKWKAQNRMKEVATWMVEAEIERTKLP